METKFFERLNELIDEKDVTCYSLALSIGVNTSTVTRWKKGITFPTIDKVALLCEYFGVTANYLLGLED